MTPTSPPIWPWPARKPGLEPETFSRLAAMAHSMTWTEWSILATAMLWLVMAALPLRQMLPRARPALTAGAVLGALVLLAAISALALRWHDLDRAHRDCTRGRGTCLAGHSHSAAVHPPRGRACDD